MAALDVGAVAAAFTSAAAITQAVLSTLRPGDHVIYETGTYYEFAAGIRGFGAQWGIDAEAVDLTDPEAVRIAVRPGRT